MQSRARRVFNALSMLSTVALAVSALAPSEPFAGEKLKPGQIHNYLSIDDSLGFKPHELPFELPQDAIARAEFSSETFFAIILKSAERCAISGTERSNVQKLFPENKVFMNRFGCDDENGREENIVYGNTNPEFSFIAVFAGLEFDEAKSLFDQSEVSNMFPGANIRKMRAILVYP